MLSQLLLSRHLHRTFLFASSSFLLLLLLSLPVVDVKLFALSYQLHLTDTPVVQLVGNNSICTHKLYALMNIQSRVCVSVCCGCCGCCCCCLVNSLAACHLHSHVNKENNEDNTLNYTELHTCVFVCVC